MITHLKSIILYVPYVAEQTQFRIQPCSNFKGEIVKKDQSPDQSPDQSLEFYKSFYEENRIRVLQYDSLRRCFYKLVEDVLGKDYYNMGMDVYQCDKLSCEDIAFKLKDRWYNIFKKR